MKLEHVHEYLTVIVATGVGIGFALYAGQLSGGGQVNTIVTIFAGMVLTVLALVLHKRVWMLIPLGWGLSGRIGLLPVPFGVRDLMVLSVFAIMMALIALKVVRRKATVELLDIVVLVNLLYLGTVFIRNPVGVEAFASFAGGRIGGRPYFNVFIGSLAYWVLARCTMTARESLMIAVTQVFSGALVAVMNIFVYFVPSAFPVISKVYMGVMASSTEGLENFNNSAPTATEGAVGGRINLLSIVATQAGGALCSYFRPVTLLVPTHFFRCFGFFLTMLAVMFSGHRSVFLWVAAMFMIGSYFRKGWMEVVRVTLVATPLMIILVAGQGVVYQLPASAQRALSFLPGKWSTSAVENAKSSSDWRFQMWKEVLTSDKYIQSRAFGDGFGFDRRELDAIYLTSLGFYSEGGNQESAMIVGSFHSGPLSAVRYAGVMGFGLFLWLMYQMARECVALIARTRGTKYFPVALFIGMPVLWTPIHFLFVFGSYDSGLPDALFTAGLIKLLKNSLDAHPPALTAAREAEEEAAQLLTARKRPKGRLVPVGNYLKS